MSTGGSAASWTLSPANSLAAIFDFAASSNRRALVVLAIVSVIAFVPGIFQIPPVDRDEARFAQATKQMIETGDYVDIRFQDEVRYKKPVGIYWLQAAVVKTAEAVGVPRARTRIWLYRIPSLAGAVGRPCPRADALRRRVEPSAPTSRPPSVWRWRRRSDRF